MRVVGRAAEGHASRFDAELPPKPLPRPEGALGRSYWTSRSFATAAHKHIEVVRKTALPRNKQMTHIVMRRTILPACQRPPSARRSCFSPV
jgi:hypothetical protein